MPPAGWFAVHYNLRAVLPAHCDHNKTAPPIHGALGDSSEKHVQSETVVKSAGDGGHRYGKCGGHVPHVPRVCYAHEHSQVLLAAKVFQVRVLQEETAELKALCK